MGTTFFKCFLLITVRAFFGVKAAFHNTDIDTDTNIFARILADTPDTRDFLSYSCGKLNGEVARHADILATILARMLARMSVSVSWNEVFNIVPYISSAISITLGVYIRRIKL